MTRCREAIPPAYTEFIGKQLLSYLERADNEEQFCDELETSGV
jgi:hypothetical protein